MLILYYKTVLWLDTVSQKKYYDDINIFGFPYHLRGFNNDSARRTVFIKDKKPVCDYRYNIWQEITFDPSGTTVFKDNCKFIAESAGSNRAVLKFSAAGD